MINADGFDVAAAHEWALTTAYEQGCTCENEPEVTLENCEEHGVHLAHLHEKKCHLAFFTDSPRRQELIAAREMN